MPLSRSCCSICAKPLSVHEAASGAVCHALACRTALSRQEKERQGRIRQAERAAAAACLERFTGETTPHRSIVVGAVPFSDRPVVPADPVRTALFRASLETAVQEAFSRARDPAMGIEEAPAQSPLAAISEAACGLCRGRCCARGGTHAFLSADAIASKIGRDPSVSAGELVETYLGWLPDRSCEGSCVYHTDQGCVLPRSMRSEICNQWRCGGLEELASALAEAEPSHVLVAAVENGEARRATFIEVDGVFADRGP